MNLQDLKQINDFIPYFNSFYGKNGLYSTGRDFTFKDIVEGLCVLFAQRPGHDFCGDSFDRELMRDILITEKDQAIELLVKHAKADIIGLKKLYAKPWSDPNNLELKLLKAAEKGNRALVELYASEIRNTLTEARIQKRAHKGV